jgi:hypothetical protein
MISPSRPLRTLREARNHPDGLATKELKEHKDDFLVLSVLSCGKKLPFLCGRCVRRYVSGRTGGTVAPKLVRRTVNTLLASDFSPDTPTPAPARPLTFALNPQRPPSHFHFHPHFHPQLHPQLHPHLYPLPTMHKLIRSIPLIAAVTLVALVSTSCTRQARASLLRLRPIRQGGDRIHERAAARPAES